MLLDLRSVLTREKGRGAVASAVSGTVASALNAAGVLALGLSAPASAALFLYVFGSLLGYSLDIVFAKREFVLSRGAAPAPIPYGALGQRARWLVRSFGRRFFFRFAVTVLIETLTGVAITCAAIRLLDRHGVLMEPRSRRVRDVCAAVASAVAVFLLFGNILRFDWAYCEVEQPLLTIVVIAWMAITLLASALAVGPPPPE